MIRLARDHLFQFSCEGIGYRRSETGVATPRDIINLFVCTYNGTEISAPTGHRGEPAHHLLHGGDRELEFRWTDDNGQVETASAKITVE